MKHQKHSILMLSLVCLLLLATVSASYFIYSNITAPISVGNIYFGTLISSYDGITMTISGTLFGVGLGAIVSLYTNTTSLEVLTLTAFLHNVTTNSFGQFTYSYSPTNGTYRYQARYLHP
jgi:hypothetical protein